MSENKIKKAVIREDLLSITNDFRKAIILNQFIYWSERVSDADKFIEKENEIARNNGEEERELFYGWIYKTAEELADEVMLGLSASQIRKYINELVSMGYITKRNNPKYKWDRTLQYRVNLVKIAKDLKQNGFPLSEYKIFIPDDEKSNAHECAINKTPTSEQSVADTRAIPETTTDITYTETITEKNKTLPIGRDDKNFSLSDEREKPKPKTAKERYLDKKANELKMQGRILTIAHDKFDKEIADEVFNGLCYYLAKYTEKTNLIHPILTDNTLTEIITKLGTFQTDYGDKIVDCPNLIQDMIDEFFNTDFGSRTGQKTNWNLPHFMSDTILNMLSERLK